MEKIKLKLGSYHRNKACSSVEAQKRPVGSTFYDEDLLNMPLSLFTRVTQPLAHIYFQVHSWFLLPSCALCAFIWHSAGSCFLRSSDPFLLSVPTFSELEPCKKTVSYFAASFRNSLEAKLNLMSKKKDSFQ